jgi:hypothetical protein
MKRKSRDATPEREHIVNGGRNKMAFYDVTDSILSPYTGDDTRSSRYGSPDAIERKKPLAHRKLRLLESLANQISRGS